MGPLAAICMTGDPLGDVAVSRTAIASGVPCWLVGVLLSLPGLCGSHPSSQVPVCAEGFVDEPTESVSPVQGISGQLFVAGK